MNGGRAEVLWDTYGVPHIYAQDVNAAAFAFGWSQMRAHGDLLLKLYAEARGESAFHWGAGFAPVDRWVISNDIPERAAEFIARCGGTIRTGAKVDALSRTGNGDWHLTLHGDAAGGPPGSYDGVVLAVPASQAALLLKQLPESETGAIAARLNALESEPITTSSLASSFSGTVRPNRNSFEVGHQTAVARRRARSSMPSGSTPTRWTAISLSSTRPNRSASHTSSAIAVVVPSARWMQRGIV